MTEHPFWPLDLEASAAYAEAAECGRISGASAASQLPSTGRVLT